MMRKILFLACLIAWPTIGIAQNIAFWIKPHIANTVTSQLDSVKNKSMSEFLGMTNATLITVDTVFNVASTAIDTSRVYKTAPDAMTIKYTTAASAGSVDLNLNFYVAENLFEFGYETSTKESPPISRFTLVKTLNITSETTDFWHIDDEVIPPSAWCMVTVSGNAGNGTTTTKLWGIWFKK